MLHKCNITTTTRRNSTDFKYKASFLSNGTLVQYIGSLVIPNRLNSAEAIATFESGPPIVYRNAKVGPVIRGIYPSSVAVSLNLEYILVFARNANLYERFSRER